MSIVGAVQTLGQLKQLYGESSESIVANFGTKIFFGGGLSLADARHASELSGTMTIDLAPDPLSWPSGTSLLPRAVLLPDEIARPPIHPLFGSPSTLFTPDLPPVQIYLPAAYELPLLAPALNPHRARPETPPPSGLGISAG